MQGEACIQPPPVDSAPGMNATDPPVSNGFDLRQVALQRTASSELLVADLPNEQQAAEADRVAVAMLMLCLYNLQASNIVASLSFDSGAGQNAIVQLQSEP